MWPEQNKDGHEGRNLVVEYYLLLNFEYFFKVKAV